ncbi:MAG: ferredoxin [Marivita sp.]|uniref:ferredoxin n=1 Tax=Marivita sp. TaxID=2003365 RepID=UPI003EF8C30A
MSLGALAADANRVGLSVRGAFHPNAEDAAPNGTQTLVMIGPDEPQFWNVFTASPEYQDRKAHPLDRWSKRVTHALAAPFGAVALFPYDGPPYAPFLRWAERTGHNWSSPVGLLVHAKAGLFISFRAVLALPDRLDLPTAPQSPCTTCATQPCANACPVGALASNTPYDVPACVAHMRSPEGAACRQGCLVRRSCPVSQTFGRLEAQSAFHMRAFLGE